MTFSTQFSHAKPGILNFLHIVILALSLFLLISISYDTFNNLSFLNQRLYLDIQLWICLFFLFVFFFELFLSKHRKHYLATHFLFLLVSIPYLNIIDYFGITFSPETTYMIRFIPMIRGGYALAIVVGWLTYSRASSLFISYVTMLAATVYFASMIFFVLEHKVNPMVTGYPAALWWATMDVTTVGSNIYAATPVGKIMSVLLAALGMMLFPIFTVYITNLVQNANRERQKYYSQLDGTAQPVGKTVTTGVTPAEKPENAGSRS
ncbi:potassium channel family protein [Oxalobacter paraformigenes]|uniref:Potassium channel domain-containing protein n=1 Tax=Oxalobacter paraformigenes TaxID=556268 RepID=T5LE92_9BURK|nr:potassium channel family protein [Oxalobacter paraformigenes]EQM95186.1 hypothetical protein OFAG_02282 [Oxalobacter paraformigenes]